MAVRIEFTNSKSLTDLDSYISRLQRFGFADSRLLRSGDTLSVFGCLQAAGSLTDTTSTVLVLKSFALAPSPTVSESSQVDSVVLLQSLRDRLARLTEHDTVLQLPDTETHASWAGVLPPKSGWQKWYEIETASLKHVAQDAILRVKSRTEGFTSSVMVEAVRREVLNTEIAPQLPLAAAYACETMGLFTDTEVFNVYKQASWVMLRAGHGDVIIRQHHG